MVKGARVLLIGLGIVRGGEKISRRIIITVRFSFYSFLLLFFFKKNVENLFGCEEN
jgi:hypothetical protein